MGIAVASVALAGLVGCGGGNDSSASAGSSDGHVSVQQFDAQVAKQCKQANAVARAMARNLLHDASQPASKRQRERQATHALHGLSRSISGLHDGLAGITPPDRYQQRYQRLVSDLGTMSQRLQALTHDVSHHDRHALRSDARKLQAAAQPLSRDMHSIPALARCRRR